MPRNSRAKRRQTTGGHASGPLPATELPKPPAGPAPGAKAPAEQPEEPRPVSTGRVGELMAKATEPGAGQPAAVAAARAELARVLGEGLDRALESADLDNMLKLTDRLLKVLPAAAPGAPAPPPEPTAGGETDGDSGAGVPTAAQRFRSVSRDVGDAENPEP